MPYQPEATFLDDIPAAEAAEIKERALIGIGKQVHAPSEIFAPRTACGLRYRPDTYVGNSFAVTCGRCQRINDGI